MARTTHTFKVGDLVRKKEGVTDLHREGRVTQIHGELAGDTLLTMDGSWTAYDRQLAPVEVQHGTRAEIVARLLTMDRENGLLGKVQAAHPTCHVTLDDLDDGEGTKVISVRVDEDADDPWLVYSLDDAEAL